MKTNMEQMEAENDMKKEQKGTHLDKHKNYK